MRYISDIDLGNLCYELLRIKGIAELSDIPNSGYDRYCKTLDIFESVFNFDMDDFREIASLLIQLTPIVRDPITQCEYNAFWEFGKLTPVAKIEKTKLNDGEFEYNGKRYKPGEWIEIL